MFDFRKMATMATLLAGTAASAAGNLITNGNFEAGNTGFGSDYGYVIEGANALQPEGVYTVSSNPINSHPLFTSYGDHTSGSGLFQIVNGSGTPNTVVWTQSGIAVTPGTTYSFSAFISSAYATSPAVLEVFAHPGSLFPSLFSITTNPLVGSYVAPGTTGVWQQISGSFNTGTASLITLSFVNQNTDQSGNDFGIDDISLTAVPEPASWALMLLGFGLVGAATRRRRFPVIAA